MIALILALTITPPIELKEPLTAVFTNPSLRTSHAPLITGDTFRNFCTYIIDETCLPFDPDRLVLGDTIFVGMPYLDYFLQNILPLIETPFILVTSNGAGTIDERYLPFLDYPQIGAWFGRNITLAHPKAHVIPLGVCWHRLCADRHYHALLKERLVTLDQSAYFCSKPIHTYCNILLSSHPYRTLVYEHFRKEPLCKFFPRCPFKDYLADLARSRFVISPRGVNIDCFRTWEALIAGSIPVVESEGINSVYDDLPVIIVDDLTKITCDELDKKFEALKTKTFHFEKLSATYWLGLIESEKNRLISKNE